MFNLEMDDYKLGLSDKYAVGVCSVGLGRRLLRNRISMTLLGLLVSVVLFTSSVLAQSGMNFSLRPDGATASANQAYFAYDAMPSGTVVQDAVLVTNAEEEAVHLYLYAADAITADDGGVTFSTGLGEAPTGAGQWISLTESELTLQPQEVRSVPFTFAIPNGLSGEHVAGIVAQNAETQEAAEGQFGVSFVKRAGVTVLTRLPGETQANLGLNALSGEASDGQQTIVVNLQNNGNVGIKAQGRLMIQGTDGTLVRELPIELGYFVPGDTLNNRFGLEPALEAAEYDVTLSLTYYDHSLTIEQGQILEHTTRLSLGELEEVRVVTEDETLVEEALDYKLIAAAALVLLFGLLFIVQSRRLSRAQQQ